MTDCVVGGLTNEEARQAVITYFLANYSLAHEVIWPNEEPPALEGRTESFILLDIGEVKKEQAGMGTRDYIIDKFLDITLWKMEYTGIKEVSLFADFVDGLGLDTVGGVVYGVPNTLDPKAYMGWSVNTILLPFKF
jgi:hypothetical protein